MISNTSFVELSLEHLASVSAAGPDGGTEGGSSRYEITTGSASGQACYSTRSSDGGTQTITVTCISTKTK